MVTGAEVKAEPENHATGQWSNFPAGLRLLVVDDDPLCLKVVEQMLRRCNYIVTTCTNATTALNVLREKNNEYDLVLSDVYMPDMDGFKLLEVVGLEMDLPVIMMSSNGDTSNVLRGVTHGACDYLIKPVRLEELRNLWQHVVRRRRQHVMDLDSDEQSQERDEECVAARNKRKAEGLAGGTEQGRAGNGAAFANGALATAPGGAAAGAGFGTCGLAHGGSSGLGNDDMLFENGSNKKARVVWSVEMHQQFVNAVNQLGIDKAVPKKILEIMNVDGLTRENVASHLQKYRLYLKRVAGQGGGHAQEKGQAAAGSGSGSGQQAQATGQSAPAGQATGQQGQGAGQPSRGGKAAAAQQAQQAAGGAAGAGAAGAGGSATGSGADPPAAGPGTGDATAAAAVAAAAPGGFPNPMLPPNPMGLGVANPMGLMGNPAAAAAAAAAAGMNPLLGAMGGLGVGGLPGLSPLGPMAMPGMQPPLGMLPGLPGGPMPGLPALPGLPGLPGPMGALNPMSSLQQMAAANFMQGMASMGQLPGMGLNPAAGLMSAMAAGMGMAGGPAAQQQQALFPQPSAVAAANAAAAAAASVPPPPPPPHLPAADGHLQGLPPAQQNPHGQHSLKRLQPPSSLDANAHFQSMTLHAPGDNPSALPGAMPPMPLSATATATPSSAPILDPHDVHGPLDLPLSLPGDMVNGLLSDGAFVGPDEVDLGLGLGLGSGSGRGQAAAPQAPGHQAPPGVPGAGAAPGMLDPAPLLGSTDHEMAAVFGDMMYVEDAAAAGAAVVPGGGSGGGGLLGGDGLGLGLGPGADPAKGLVVTDDDFFNFLLKG